MGKSAVVCGAGGFIANRLVKRLKAEGYWVRGVDIKRPEFSASAADDFQISLDCRSSRSSRICSCRCFVIARDRSRNFLRR